MHHPIDLHSWERRDTYHFFRDFDDPFFNATAPVDATRLVAHAKAGKESFSWNVLYCLLRAANEIPEFCLRILGDSVVRYDVLHGGTTVLRPDNTFTFCYFDYHPDRETFLAGARKAVEQSMSQRLLDPKDHEFNRVHFSAVPWIAFTGVKHAKKRGNDDSIPKIVFGKYTEEAGRMKLPLSVEVNHALMDGYHVGRYFEKVQDLLDQF